MEMGEGILPILALVPFVARPRSPLPPPTLFPFSPSCFSLALPPLRGEGASSHWFVLVAVSGAFLSLGLAALAVLAGGHLTSESGSNKYKLMTWH